MVRAKSKQAPKRPTRGTTTKATGEVGVWRDRWKRSRSKETDAGEPIRIRWKDALGYNAPEKSPPIPPMAGTLLEEFQQARWDIARFARLLGIDAHDGQRRFWDAMLARDPSGWRAAYLTLALSAGNRAGKTLAIAIAILHSCFYKTALRPLDPRATDREAEVWAKAPYDWFHFGIQQEVGELVYFEMVNIFSGRHPAQKGKGCPLADLLGEQLATWDVKERGEYRLVTLHPLFGGAAIHFRTTNERALGSLGKDMHGISFDECGFEQNLTFIINEVLHLRRLGTGGQLLLTSTPSEGFTEFSDEWKHGDPGNPLRLPDRISLRMSTRENIGYGIDQTMFDRLVRGMPPDLVPQNIDGYFIEGRRAFFNSRAVDIAFRRDLPLITEPVSGHRYVMGIDPAATHDETWALVLDVTVSGRTTAVLAERRQGKQSVLGVVKMLKETHDAYNENGARCSSAIDSTGFGGSVFRDLLSGIHPLRSVEFGGTNRKKLKMLANLKGLIEQGRMQFPREGPWLELRRQLLAYRIDDKKLKTDAVMALCVAITEVVRSPMDGGTDHAPFDIFGEVHTYPIRRRTIEDAEAEVIDLRSPEEVMAARALARRMSRGTVAES